MKRNAKTRAGAADAGDGDLTAPGLPQARNYGDYTIIDDWRASLDTDGDIVVTVDQLQNTVTDGDTITVYFGNAPPQYWVVEKDTNPPYDAPYPFLFKAGELPDGTYEVYYTVKNPDSIGGSTYKSPKVSVTIVNSPNPQTQGGVVVDHIKLLPIDPNNANPGQQDGVHVVVCNKDGSGVPNAWVIFYGPDDQEDQKAATFDPYVMQTGSDGQASTKVSYPGSGVITVDIWSGRQFQDANPTFGSSSEGYSLGLQVAPDDQTAYGNGTTAHKARAVIKYGGNLATDADQQQTVDFTLPPDQSAVFFPNGQKKISVPSQGGYAEVSFTDSKYLGETVELDAAFDTAGLAPPAPPLPFIFKPVWELDLTPEADDQPADGSTADKATATVYKDGQPADDGTLVEFQLGTSTSATFAEDIPNIQSYDKKSVIVATSGGTAEAWFVDGKSSGDTATLTASLADYPDVPSTPTALRFTFAPTSQTHTITLLQTMNWAVNWDNGPKQNRIMAQVMNSSDQLDASYTGIVTFTLPDDSSATFVDSTDPKYKEMSAVGGLADASFVSSAQNGEKVAVKVTLKDGSATLVSQDFTFGDEFPPFTLNLPATFSQVLNLPVLIGAYYTTYGPGDSNPHLVRFSLPVASSAYFDPDNQRSNVTLINRKCCQISMPDYHTESVLIVDCNQEGEIAELAVSLVDVAGQAATSQITFNSA